MLGITTGEWTDEARGQEAQDSVQRQQVALVPACTYLGPAHVIVYIVLRSRARRASECMN